MKKRNLITGTRSKFRPQLFVCLLFFVPFFTGAQKVLKVSRKAQMVYSKYDHCYMVFDDSTHYYTYNPKAGAWRMHSMHMVLEPGWDLLTFKQRFYPLAIGKKHFLFVMDGCGMVYELKHDTLRRIDNSYDQKNQFGSALYAYRGEPYMFGGYGLFEVKNTHTYFDFAAKEWFEVGEKRSEGYPDARTTPYFIQTAKDLFVLGGVKKYMTYNKILQDIWRFDLQKKHWELLGELNPDFVYRTKVRGFVQNKDYRLFHANNQLTVVDIYRNKYYSYKSSHYLSLARLIPDEQMNWVLDVRQNSNDTDVFFLKVRKFKEILHGLPTEYYLYKPLSWFKQFPIASYLWLSALLNVGLFFILFYSHRITKTAWYRPKHPILYRKDFSEVEWEALLLIKKNDELELSALNYLFDEPGLSYETLKKRRESFVRALRIKLALITRRDVEQLLQESKHPLDKRMKIIRWSNDLEINKEE
jgi:hypothetical protein